MSSKTVKVKYEDGPEAVDIPALEALGRREPVKRGEAVAVPEDIAEQLCKQGWERVNESAKPAKSPGESRKED